MRSSVEMARAQVERGIALCLPVSGGGISVVAISEAVNDSLQPLPVFGGGTMLGAAATIQKGEKVFQRYTLRHVLGVGGMGWSGWRGMTSWSRRSR